MELLTHKKLGEGKWASAYEASVKAAGDGGMRFALREVYSIQQNLEFINKLRRSSR